MGEDVGLAAGERVLVGNAHDLQADIDPRLHQHSRARFAQAAVYAVFLDRHHRSALLRHPSDELHVQRFDRVHADHRTRDALSRQRPACLQSMNHGFACGDKRHVPPLREDAPPADLKRPVAVRQRVLRRLAEAQVDRPTVRRSRPNGCGRFDIVGWDDDVEVVDRP